MRHTNFFKAFFLAVSLFAFMPSLAHCGEKEDRIIYAMLMNQIQYSLLTVQHYQSRAVLEKEYDNIICKIDKTRLVDSESVEAYTNLLETLTDLKLSALEKQFLTQQAEKERKQAVNKILNSSASAVGMAAVAFAGGNPVQAVTGLLFTGVSSVFNYRNTVNSVENSLNSNLFRISQSDLRALDSERNSLFRTYSRFITKYKIPKKYEIKEDQMRWLVESLDTLDASSKARLLETKRDIFALFTPFWYELGASYQEIGNKKKALECYAEFERQKQKYSIIDNDTYYTELAKNMILLLGEGEKVSSGAKKYIDVIENDRTVASENENRMYLAELYFASGDTKRAEEKLRLVMDDSREYLSGAHELYTLIASQKTGKDKERNDVLSRSLISALEVEEVKKQSDKAEKSIADKVKNAAASVYSYISQSVQEESASLSLELPFSFENTPDVLSVVSAGNTFVSEKKSAGGVYRYVFGDSAQKIVPKEGEVSVKMYFPDGKQITAVYDCALFSGEEVRAMDSVLSILENSGVGGADLNSLNVKLFSSKCVALTKDSAFKKKSDSEKLRASQSIVQEARKAYLASPYVYFRENSRIGSQTIFSYGLKSVSDGSKEYVFSKYGDAVRSGAK